MTRPILLIPRTGLDLLLDALALAGVLAAALLTAYHLPALPATVPMRFSFSGTPVASGPKQALWVLPGVALFIFLLLAAFSRAPHIHNYLVKITEENAERQYRNAVRALQTVNVLCMWMLAVLTWEMIAAARTGAAPASAIWFFLGGLLGVVALFVLRAWRLR